MITARLEDLEFHGDYNPNGLVLTVLEGWDDLPDAKSEQDAWSTENGNATPGRTLYDGRSITLEGYYESESSASTELMMRRLRGLAGRMLTLQVDKGNGFLHAPVELRGITIDEARYRGKASFQLSLLSPSAFLYGVSQSASTLAESAGVGIEDPLVENLQEGETGNPGRVVITGSGYAPTSVSVTVTGVMEGVRIINMELNGIVELAYPIQEGDTVTFDYDNRRCIINNQSDLTGYLSVEGWTNPTGQSTFQFRPLGTHSEDAMMTVNWMEAYR